MADIYYNALPTKETASVPTDKVLIIDSVDGLVKQQAATQFVGPTGATGPQGDPGAVDSVNGQTGVVVLDTGDIADVADSRYVTDAQLADIGTALQPGDVTDASISFTDITDNDASTSKHGFLKKLPGGTTTFLRADGAFATPSGQTNSYTLVSFTAQTSVNVIHNFGTYPNVQVLDNTGAVLVPLTITNNTVNDFTVTFVSSTTGNIIATVGSPQPNEYTAVSTTYSILTSDETVNCTSGTFTATLYTAVGNAGRKVNIINSGSGVITIATTSSQTIGNGTSGVIPEATTQTVSAGEVWSLISDGSNWKLYA